MKKLRKIAVLLFCTGLLWSATSCAVAIPTGDEGYNNNNGNRHRFHERRHERHNTHVGMYGESDGRHEH